MKSKLNMIAILALALVAGGAVMASDGLAGWWLLGETSGISAADSSSGGNNGYLVGSANFVTDPQMGGAVEFFGPSGGVVVPFSPAFTPARGTVTMWVNAARIHEADLVTMRTDRLVRRDANSLNYAYTLRIQKHGAVEAIIGNDDPNAEFPITVLHGAGGLIKTNKWQHVAMRWDGSVLAVFVDGKLVGAVPYNEVPELGLSYSGNSDLTFGEAIWPMNGGTLEFQGRLADVRIFSRPLNETEIAQMFAEKAGGSDSGDGSSTTGKGSKKR
ncbi:MAG TPA: LamG domain-containing protein [Candidatus Acidoferrales bacterium]